MPPMTATVLPIAEKTCPSIITIFVGWFPCGATVVWANPIPEGPTDKVSPWTTIVWAGAPGPMLYEVPSTTAVDGPTVRPMPCTVVGFGVSMKAPPSV